MMTVNTLEKLLFWVFAAAGLVFVYGALSMYPAFARSAPVSKPVHYTLWVWQYTTTPPGWSGEMGLTYDECIEERDHFHLRGEGLNAQEADPDMEAHFPVCLPDGRGHPRGGWR